MPKLITKPNEKINGYTVNKLLNRGAMAISYAATAPTGEKVFFKQYKSPTVTVEWYRGYVEYQKELKRRVETGPAKLFSYRMIDFFEANYGHPTYFQVFEFVEEGHDLGHVLEQIRSDPRAVSWEQRLIFAKVIMAAINALHNSGVVHCDLKPPNIQLFKDPTIDAGYVVKLIDMDYSILHDRRAPWHGIQGYVGSPGYFSPEHLAAGGAPLAQSDVFTCGLILYELLANQHPYRFDTPEDYARAAQAHSAPPPKLVGAMPAPAANADVEAALHRCLHPTATARPTAGQVLQVLNGKLKASELSGSAVAPTGGSSPAPPPVSDRPPATDDAKRGCAGAKLALQGPDGRAVQMTVRTEIGKYILRPLGDDHVYYDSVQCTLEPSDRGWIVTPHAAAKHQTLVNGKKVTSPTVLNHGDVLAVGSEERAIQKLPLTVQIS